MDLSTNTQQKYCHNLTGRGTYMHRATFFIYLFFFFGYWVQNRRQKIESPTKNSLQKRNKEAHFIAFGTHDGRNYICFYALGSLASNNSGIHLS